MSTQSIGAGRNDLARLLTRIQATAQAADEADAGRPFLRAVAANQRLDDHASPLVTYAWAHNMLTESVAFGTVNECTCAETVIRLTDHGRDYLELVALAAHSPVRKAA